MAEQVAEIRREVHESGDSRRRNRMEDLEEMMMMEAIRLSLAAEEERKRKSEKEAAKEEKKKVKEEKKKEKLERKGVYGSGASSASGSALSLSLPGFSRRRGNSGGSNLAREVTPEHAEAPGSKGKGVDHNGAGGPAASSTIDFARAESSTMQQGIPGARHLDQATLANIQDSHKPPSPTAPDRPSHLRQMSSASSQASSFIESAPGSLLDSTIDSTNASGTNTAGKRSSTHEGGDANGSAGAEPMFNFRSLAAMIDNDDEHKEGAANHIEHGGNQKLSIGAREETPASGSEERIASDAESDPPATLLGPQSITPEVVVTPGTPAALNYADGDGMQLGADAENLRGSSP
jgi:hypothetical protein